MRHTVMLYIHCPFQQHQMLLLKCMELLWKETTDQNTILINVTLNLVLTFDDGGEAHTHARTRMHAHTHAHACTPPTTHTHTHTNNHLDQRMHLVTYNVHVVTCSDLTIQSKTEPAAYIVTQIITDLPPCFRVGTMLSGL
jgi:hypothetical protein